MTTKLAFCDTETSGLYPHLGHEVWEVALVVRTLSDELQGAHAVEVDHHWFLPVDRGRADPYALTIGGFYERYPMLDDFAMNVRTGISRPEAFAAEFARLTHGAQLVGAVPSFDAERFLAPLLRKHGACPGWHHHLIDVEQLAWGWLHGRMRTLNAILDRPTDEIAYMTAEFRSDIRAELRGIEAAIKAIGLPFESEELSRACGVDPDRYPKHTAEGDVRWAMALYDAVVDG